MRKAVFFAAPALLSSSMLAAVPQYDHVVVVVEENHSYTQITSTYASSAPYINQTLAAQGAKFTNFFSDEHESEGNYLWMFAGSDFNIGFNDPVPVGPFSSPNLGSELLAAGDSFKGYSEDLPSIGYTGNTSGNYARKHNPWVNFSNVPDGTTAATSSNLRLTDFPTDFTQLPTVSFVIPNQNDDMHNGSDPSTIATGDTWLQTHLDSYYQWAKTHNSLLIVTWDEDNGTGTLTNPAAGQNKILTVVAGAGIAAGSYTEGAGATHVNMLRTLEDMYSLPHAGNQATLATNAGIGNGSMSDFFVQWKNDADGTWATGSNWVGGVSPASSSAVANLLGAISTTRTITVAGTPTVNVLNIDNPHSYIVAGPGTITFSGASDGSSKIRVASGSHVISAGVVLSKPTTIDITAGASLTMSNFDAGGVDVTKQSAGYLELDKLRAGAVTINAGTVAITANGSDTGLSRVASINLAGGATPTAAIDLKDNDLVITSSTYGNVSSAIQYARNDGAWNRGGISTSLSSTIHTLGTLTGLQFHNFRGVDALFDNAGVADTDILVKYTYLGDTDFNGKVDGSDYAHLDLTFGNEATQGNIGGWANGDLNYDGKVDGGDYALADLGFNGQSGTLARAIAFLDGSDTNRNTMTGDALGMVMQHFDEFGSMYATSFLAAIPEPVHLVALSTLSVLLKRRRR